MFSSFIEKFTKIKKTPIPIAFGIYVFASAFFYYFPHFLHRGKKTRRNSNFLILSHRGGAGECVENTLAAFQNSKDVGVDSIELDCHITKDGKVVVAHDNDLSRLAGVNMLISDLDYHELPNLVENPYQAFVFRGVSSKLKDSKSVLSKRALNDHSKRIPLLEEVFEKFPELGVNLDIKINNDDLVEKVHELIVKHNKQKSVVWGSFHEKVLKKCHKLNPNIEIYFSLIGCFKLFFLSITGLLPFVPFKETHLEIIMPNFIIKNNKDLPVPIYLALSAVKLVFVRKSFVQHLQKRGISVIYWVLNEEEEFEYAINLGVNGIITDFPSKLVKYVEENSSAKLKRKLRDQ